MQISTVNRPSTSLKGPVEVPHNEQCGPTPHPSLSNRCSIDSSTGSLAWRCLRDPTMERQDGASAPGDRYRPSSLRCLLVPQLRALSAEDPQAGQLKLGLQA
jgi:hypothetical protein